jgi:hypothetical protein
MTILRRLVATLDRHTLWAFNTDPRLTGRS